MERVAKLTTSEVSSSTKSGELCLGTQRIVRTGTWLKIARLHDELWLENGIVEKPDRLVAKLRESQLGADLFTFSQMLPDTDPHYCYALEWDNISVAETNDFEGWWTSLPQESRKNVRRSRRRGVSVQAAELDDAFVDGIKVIYDETPVRQGRRFPHYRKELDVIKRENSSYLDRALFIGAYFDGDLIGFIKIVFLGKISRIMQIISLNAHEDKRPTNALLAKAIEMCSERRISHLIYGQHVYDNKANSSVTEFKRRNGFHQVLLPRYYVPLSYKGRLALSLRLHRGLKERIPSHVRDALLRARTLFYAKVTKTR